MPEKSLGITLELKDLDTSKRTAVIKHSVYGSIDRAGDISHKGMFNRSWNIKKPKIYINHDAKQIPGTTIKTFEDDNAGFTELKFGNWTLGNDSLEMADAGIFTGASFGYVTEKKDFSTVNGKKVRNLREVRHEETSLLTVEACHPEAGLVSLNKAFDALELKQLSDTEQSLLKSLLLNDQSSIEQLVQLLATIQPSSDLYTWLSYQLSSRADRMGSIMSQLYWNTQQMNGMKSYVERVENYCTKAKASDETIIQLQDSLKEQKQIISDYDTAITPLATDEIASDDEVKSMLMRINIALAV